MLLITIFSPVLIVLTLFIYQVYVMFYFQHVIVDSMDMAVSLFASVTKVAPYHVTLLMGGATVTRDGLGKSALCVSNVIIPVKARAGQYSNIINY